MIEFFSFFVLFRVSCFLIFISFLVYCYRHYVHAKLVHLMNTQKKEREELVILKESYVSTLEVLDEKGRLDEQQRKQLFGKISHWQVTVEKQATFYQDQKKSSGDHIKKYLMRQAEWLSLYDVQKEVLPQAFENTVDEMKHHFVQQAEQDRYIQKIFMQLSKGQ